jgi:hypothetical protein
MNDEIEIRREEARARRDGIRATPKGPEKKVMKKIHRLISHADFIQDRAEELHDRPVD